MLIVQASQTIRDGDGYYRLHEPIRALGGIPGLLAIDCDITHRYFWYLAEVCDVLILHFFSNWLFFPLIENRRRQGKVTVFETNDYFEDLQPWNPIAEPWLNPDIRKEHKEHIVACDAVQTSTARLADHIRPLARKVAVFRNHLVDVPPLLPSQKRPLTIGWAGSQGHLADWFHTTKVLEPWLKQHPDVHLAVMSNAHAKEFISLPDGRFHFQAASSIEDYYDFLTHLDIGLAPLLPTEYNRCRSDVKFLEYASRGVVGIYSNLEPYSSVVDGVNGLLYDSDERLLTLLDRLVFDHELRNKIRLEAHNYVKTTRILKNNIGERADFYRSLLRSPPQTIELPEEIFEAGKREGNYLRIELDNAGKLYFHSTQEQNSARAIETISQIVKGYPDYLFPLQTLGKLHNDARQPQRALEYLRRALELGDNNLRTITEIGRAYFLSKDLRQANAFLRKSVEIEPAYIPGWEALLRYIRFCPQPDNHELSQRALELHPQSYTITLLCAELLSGAARITFLESSLHRLSKTLTRAQLAHGAANIMQGVASAVCELLSSEESLKLLELTAQIFPHSHNAALLLGRCYRARGLHEKAEAEFLRAFNLRQSGIQYGKEAAHGDESQIYALMTEHLSSLSMIADPDAANIN